MDESEIKTIDLGFSINQGFLSYINKALSRIIHLLPKTGEMIQTKICTSLRFIISRIEINHNALLPFFSYFYLNSNSAILTLTAIKIVENFKSSLKENFILKLVLKLCILINDLRLNKSLRILAIRWILNLRFSNYNFNFGKYMGIFCYYLSPFPFDNLTVCMEKLKTLYLFHHTITEKECNIIIKSISIMDNYKYFPIFSNYVKSLFKAYFFIILRFPYKNFIKQLCEILRNNLKEIPRILPNMINLLRTIRNLNEEYCNFPNSVELKDDKEPNVKSANMKMTFREIYIYLLVKFSKFIAKFNSHTKLNKYFELFIEIAKENSISPQNLIIGLRNLHASIQEIRNWKMEKNILEVCGCLLKHHHLQIMKQNKIDELLYDIHKNSFDYGIRDKAKLYYKLVTNVEKPILNTFLETNNKDFNENFLKVSYEYVEFNSLLKLFLILEQSTEERFKAKLEDGGTSIFDKNFEQNVNLLSDISNDKNFKYSDFVYKRIINSDKIPAKKLNDLVNKENIDEIIEGIITPNDILRLFVNDSMIDDTNDAQIDPLKLFQLEREFRFAEDDKLKDVLDSNDEQEILKAFLHSYFLMIQENKFYIKLPLDLYMVSHSSDCNKYKNDPLNKDYSLITHLEKIKEIYSISLCFGKMSHLEIRGPILLPYLELNTHNDKNYKFPYFYKIYLFVYPLNPIPSDVEVRAIFYDKQGTCCTGILNSIKIKFEDFFLPIGVPPQFKNFYSNPKAKILSRGAIFKKLWKDFKIGKKSKDYVNSSRTLDFNSEKMIKLVSARLGPFLIDENFTEMIFIVKNPYKQDDNCSASDLNPVIGNFVEKTSNDSDNLTITQKGNEEKIVVKNYYDSVTGKFKTISYDFIMDEFLEKNSDKSFYAKNNVLRNSWYHLAEVLIFVPEK